MRMTIAKMAQDLLDRMLDHEMDPEPQYEPELESLNPMQKREIKASLVKLIKGDYLDNPLEGG
jgi:hypothetical protein